VWDELARRGYKIFKIWRRYLGLGFPRTFIYNLKASSFMAGMINAYKPSMILIIFGGVLWFLVMRVC
jgi:hypothetical protein